MKDDLVYTLRLLRDLPFPRELRDRAPPSNPLGQAYYEFRADLMVRNNEGLTKTYNRFHDPDERSPDILKLRELHAAMDRAVLDAYGWTDLKPTCEFLLDYEEDEDEDESGAAAAARSPGATAGPTTSATKSSPASWNSTAIRGRAPERCRREPVGQAGRTTAERKRLEEPRPTRVLRELTMPKPARSPGALRPALRPPAWRSAADRLLGDVRALIEAAREQTAARSTRPGRSLLAHRHPYPAGHPPGEAGRVRRGRLCDAVETIDGEFGGATPEKGLRRMIQFAERSRMGKLSRRCRENCPGATSSS